MFFSARRCVKAKNATGSRFPPRHTPDYPNHYEWEVWIAGLDSGITRKKLTSNNEKFGRCYGDGVFGIGFELQLKGELTRLRLRGNEKPSTLRRSRA
jgi:hypothetical protein